MNARYLIVGSKVANVMGVCRLYFGFVFVCNVLSDVDVRRILVAQQRLRAILVPKFNQPATRRIQGFESAAFPEFPSFFIVTILLGEEKLSWSHVTASSCCRPVPSRLSRSHSLKPHRPFRLTSASKCLRRVPSIFFSLRTGFNATIGS
jgi:hypothetical protein